MNAQAGWDRSEGATILVASPGPGAGCTLTAAALASALAPRRTTVVLDCAPKALSPWSRALSTVASSGFTVGPPTPHTVGSMTSRRALLAPASAGFDVLTLTTSARAGEPRDVSWWHEACTAGGWSAALVDLGTPLLADPLAYARWATRTKAVLVLVVPATRPAAAAATRLITGSEAAGSDQSQVVLAPISRAPGRWDGRVLAELTMLDRRVAATVSVPFDRELHRGGLRGIDRMHPRTARASARLAETAVGLATTAPPTHARTRTLQEVS